MDNNLTIDTRVFSLSQTPAGGGTKRINKTDGANLPETLMIRHMDAKDSSTKMSTRRTNVRLDKTIDGLDGTLPVVSASLTVSIPKHAAVTSAHILAAVQRLISLLQEDDTGLDLMDEIFVNEEA